MPSDKPPPNRPPFLSPCLPSNSFVSSLSSKILSNIFCVDSNCVSDSRSSSTLSSLLAAKSVLLLSLPNTCAVACFACVFVCCVSDSVCVSAKSKSPAFLAPLVSRFLKPLLIRSASASPSSSARIALSILLPMIGIFVRPTLAASYRGLSSFLKSLNASFNLVDKPSISPNFLFVSPTVVSI